MDTNTELIILYDYYGSLLSEQQQCYFEAYYFNNLSLAEISDLYKVSRNAIHKQLKSAEDKLNLFEDKLNLKKKYQNIEKILPMEEFKKIEEYI